MKNIIRNTLKIVLPAAIVIGILFAWYVFAEGIYCGDHEIVNPDINFEFTYRDGCMVELSDGNWVNLRAYKDLNKYRLEIEE